MISPFGVDLEVYDIGIGLEKIVLLEPLKVSRPLDTKRSSWDR